jgi:light-regulated signal transduction histidine kinase (bacteriophytochrome)
MADPIEPPHEKPDELERLLRQRTDELRDAQKDLEDFNYSVSHDLRAPLRHITGYAQIILEDFGNKLAPQCRQYFESIQDGARTMGMQLDELLKLSRLGRQELCRQPVELGPLVQAVVQDLAHRNAARIVEWKIEPLPRTDCDATMMKQVFNNLISNSLKFTRPRAVAVIEIGTVGEAAVGAAKGNGETIFVRDNGVGFDMKYSDKLFGIFQRLHAKKEFEGVGAGLASAQRILRRHGGRIWAEAAMDKGATFYFTLDRTRTEGH